jgi:RimJ/RimL family protein N-acetyltransferase
MSSVTLRRARTDDAELIHRWRSEASTATYQPILPLALPEVRSMLATRAAYVVSPASTGKFQWLIVAGERPVGWVTLEIDEARRLHSSGVIGYTVGEAFRGNRYGRAGVSALLPIAFGRDALNLERLEAIAAVDNLASRRVLEGSGFRQEGVLRGLLVIRGERIDHAIFGLLRTEWEESNQVGNDVQEEQA